MPQQRLPPWPDLAPLEPVLASANIVGLFEWDMAADRIYPCLGMTQMFGLDLSTIREGAPVAAFLPALHPKDRDAFSERMGDGRNPVEQTIYRIAVGERPVRTVLDVIRFSFDPQGRPNWACGALFDYPGAGPATATLDGYKVLAGLDRAAGLAIELKRTVQEVDNPTLHTLVDMVLVQIASSLARQMEQPDDRRLN